MSVGRLLLGLAVMTQMVSQAAALETDQFYAWTRPLDDATDAINAEVNAGIGEVLNRVNGAGPPCSCDRIKRAIRDRFGYAIISRFEVWAMATSLLTRAPASAAEEVAYRRAWLYGSTYTLDTVKWMPPSPTIEVAGVRMGTDKLGHFFSDGERAQQWYYRTLKNGGTDDEAVARAMRVGFTGERTIWGQSSSGILSLSDLEVNYQGLMFYRALCDGSEPTLQLTPVGWRMRKPFDFRDYVSPEWDESWQPSVYSPARWAKVKPVMLRYCDARNDPAVRARRAAYAARDRETAVDAIVRELVASGKLADPRQFSIDAVCSRR